MRIGFRSKLGLIVGAALLTLVLVLAGGAISGRKEAEVLSEIEGRLVPKLELGPRLEAELERMRQNMQDAVAAQDPTGLDAAAKTKEKIFALLTGAGGALTPAQAAAIRWSVHEYFQTADGVSRRLIEGETGEQLVADMARMQAQQARATDLVKETTRLDKAELAAAFAALRRQSRLADNFRLVMCIGGLAVVFGLSIWASRGAFRGLTALSDGFARFGTGDFSRAIPITTNDDLGKLAHEANLMAANLQELSEERERSAWLKEGQAGLFDALQGDADVPTLAERALRFLAPRLQACAAVFYVVEEDGRLQRASSFATMAPANDEDDHAPSFVLGEGLLGQAAQADDLRVIDRPPPDYLKIRSGLGESAAAALVFLPLSSAGKPTGVLEFAFFEPCADAGLQLLRAVRSTLAIALESARSQAATRALLERTQQQAEQLAAQEEELRLNNQELLSQQEDLRAINEELEAQRRALSEKNRELEEARHRVQQKADEVARVSSYKSQFLANMSHELRTPLNSMLLLSHLLADNEAGNLTPKQVEHCKTIHGAGQDLLSLINQVLDLAKIEAGKQEVSWQTVELGHLAVYARRVFEPLANEKGLRLDIQVDPAVPGTIVTDQQRVERILTNLLGNAIKFTEHGEVTLRIERAPGSTTFSRPELQDGAIALSVTDTGIGIAPEAQERIFSPFEQVESSARRRYSGTGLGLAIVRESVGLLGGEVTVESVPGRGSTFTCYLPLKRPVQAPKDATAGVVRLEPVVDDRVSLAPSEPCLLVIEDDAVLAERLVDIIHARKFKALVAATGEEGLALARGHSPKGIILDVKLPDIDGWTVMERLRADPRTRSIPVHFVSSVEAPERGLSLGAIGYLTKPATHADLAGMVKELTPLSPNTSPRILVVEDSQAEGTSIVELLSREAFEAHHVVSARAALEALERENFGCLILDLGLQDMDGLGLLETLRTRAGADMPRVIVHTGRSLSKKETRELEAYAQAVILKDGHSGERLVEEVRLFVRHLSEDLPREPRVLSPESPANDVSLSGVKLLVAEDDIRTVYALSALLRGKGADVLVAETGREALELLEQHGDVQGVLMDIMMPVMDGYEATRTLREDPRFAKLPVIALTARAMKGERERCLAAGANDYLTKPVDTDRLLAALQTWVGPRRTTLA